MDNNIDPQVQQRLRKEFNSLDTNRDGRVDKNEMNTFLLNRGIDEEHCAQIVDELFEKCDPDSKNRIDLNKFCLHYLDTKN